jgi:HEAT repeat protein
MKRSNLLAITVAAVVLAGAGVWLGRATSSAADPEARAHASRTPARSAAIPATATAAVAASAAPRSPALPRTSSPALAGRATRIATPGLEADLADPDPRVRAAAVRELAAGPDPDADVLRAAVRDPDSNVSGLAVRGLGTLHARGAVSAQELLEHAANPALHERVRVAALNGAGVVPSSETARALADLLARGQLFERRSAAILLVHQDPAIAIPALIAALADPDEGVRLGVLESLRIRSRGRDFGTDAAAWRAWWQSRSP